MTDKELIKEFKRWVKADKPNVWVRYEKDDNYWDKLKVVPSWNCTESMYYIVDDKHAELRKLQIDKPDTKFQRKHIHSNIWVDVENENDLWDLFYDYRVKSKEWYEDKNIIGKPVWVRDKDYKDWRLDIFKEYNKKAEHPFKCKFYCWVQAKPVKPEDCYQGTENEN